MNAARYDELIRLAKLLGFWDDVAHWEAEKAKLTNQSDDHLNGRGVRFGRDNGVMTCSACNGLHVGDCSELCDEHLARWVEPIEQFELDPQLSGTCRAAARNFEEGA